jgi:hypothetical protein
MTQTIEWNPYIANFEVVNGKIFVCRGCHEGPHCEYTELSSTEAIALIDHFRYGLAKIVDHRKNAADDDDIVSCAKNYLTIFEFTPDDHCLVHSRQMRDMDTMRCSDWTPEDEPEKDNDRIGGERGESEEMHEGCLWVGKLPSRKSWYLYLEFGSEIIPLAKFPSSREASTFVEEPVKDGVRCRVGEWPRKAGTDHRRREGEVGRTERNNWENVTPEDATDAELRLVHKIFGPKPEWMDDANWRNNMRSCANEIRKNVALTGSTRTGDGLIPEARKEEPRRASTPVNRPPPEDEAAEAVRTTDGMVVARERPVRLAWSPPAPPCEECHYNHTRAATPFGPFLLTWKGWKGYSTPGFDETPGGEVEYHGWNSVEEAQEWAKSEMERRIKECFPDA